MNWIMASCFRVGLTCIALLLWAASSVHAQVKTNSAFSFGPVVGVNMPYSIFGIHANYRLPILKKRLEVEAGIGFPISVKSGIGLRFRVLQASEKAEFYVGSNFAHLSRGYMSFSLPDETHDFLDFDGIDYLNYYASFRIWPHADLGYEISCGYSDNITGVNVHPDSSPRSHESEAIRILNGGFQIGGAMYLSPNLSKKKK